MTSGALYRVGPLVAASALLALVAACGRYQIQEEREPWRAQAELQCIRSGVVKASWAIERSSAMQGPGTCGMDQPLRVSALSAGTVGMTQRATLGCPMVHAADLWLADIVQPAAQALFGQAVVEARMGSYSCRPRNNQRGAKLSEHSFGNALDVFAFRLNDGREITVKGGWRGAPEEQEFLREVFVGSCRHFATVLGPGADAFHYDHFHLDLARHGARGDRTVCKPVIKFTPRSGGGVEVAAARSPVASAARARQSPIDGATGDGVEPESDADIDPNKDPYGPDQ